MDIRGLKSFMAVAEYKNFTRAAEVLGYSQSAVTIQIQQLESELGLQLFDRIGKKVDLTEWGYAFLEYADEAVSAMIRAENFNAEESKITGTIRIGTMESLMMNMLSKSITSFNNRFPKVKVEIITESSTNLFEMLNANEIDLVFLFDYRHKNVNWIRVCEYERKIVFVANPNNRFARKKKIKLKDIVDEKFVLMPSDDSYQNLFRTTLAEKQLMVRPFLQLESTTFARKTVENYDCISVLPEYAVNKSVEEGKCVILDIAECDLKLWLQICHHKNKVITPAINGFMEEIINALEND